MRPGTTGRTTRYQNHREAIKGSFLWPRRLPRAVILGLTGASVGTVIAKFLIGEPGEIFITLALQLCALTAAWPVGGIVLYAVNVAAGGIMSREERERS